MKKIKLLHISRPTEFGIYKFLMDLIKNTDRDKFEISLACPEQGPLMRDLKGKGVRLIPLYMARDIKFVDDARSFRAIFRLLASEKWDLVHTHCSKAGFMGRISARMLSVPGKIYTPNSWYFDEPLPEIKKRFYIFLERFAAYFGDRIVTVTNEERSDIISKRISSPSKIVTIHDGIDTANLHLEDAGPLRKRYSIPEGNKVVGMIARLVSQKDPCTFVRLAGEVTKEIPNVTFVMVGDGPLRKAVEALKEKYGLGNRLILTGECDIDREFNMFLSLVDISVLTSLYEGLPLIALQSMYLKKPLMITQVRGIREVIESGKNGFIVPIGRLDVMKTVIVKLLKDEDKMKRVGLEAHRTVEERFTAGRMAAKYEELYLTLAGRARE